MRFLWGRLLLTTLSSLKVAEQFENSGLYVFTSLFSNLKDNREDWGKSDCLCFIQGQVDADVMSYSKSNTIQVVYSVFPDMCSFISLESSFQRLLSFLQRRESISLPVKAKV